MGQLYSKIGSYWKVSEEMVRLPEELVVDIVSRLPPKSVGKCRCVCKTWRAVLSEPEFIRTHLHRTKILSQESLIIWEFDSMAKAPPYLALLRDAPVVSNQIIVSAAELCFSDPSTVILGSCDGLVLVDNDRRRNYCVLNPITREMVRVPPPPVELPPGSFPPHHINVLNGLGYDSVSHDYKIVFVSVEAKSPSDLTIMFAQVYSLKSGSWKSTGSYTYATPIFSSHKGVFIDGRIHWYGRKMIDKKPIILIFDLLEEKLGEILPPPKCIGSARNQLGVLGGCLSMLEKASLSDISVWVMKKYSVAESWTRFTIHKKQVDGCSSLPQFGEQSVIMSYAYSKHIAKYFMCFIYNLKQGTSTDIVINGKSQSSIIIGSFLETLVSPHGPWQS